MALQPGQTILNGKYHILKLIGEGGMARVWLAEELTFGNRSVALKEPRPDLLPDQVEEVRQRYQREVQVCAALDKAKAPNVVRAITAEPYDDSLLLAMEYMPGGDLATLLAQHPGGLPVERAVAIAVDLLRALAGVHGHELEPVHRDVKPSNVLFDARGVAHLADFGLAQLAGVSGRSQLRGGQHPGTPMYMAPEQEASPRALTPAADLYALGCVLFEMLTGKRYKRVRPETAASALRREVPGWLDTVVARALAEDPWNRWQEAAEMAAALEAGVPVAVGGAPAAPPEAQAAGERKGVTPTPAILKHPAWPTTASGLVIATPENVAQLLALPQPPAQVWWEKADMELCLVPASEFLMGSVDDDRHARDDEKPQRRVYVDACYISRYPVTQAQYARFVREAGHRVPYVEEEWAAPYNWDQARKAPPQGKEQHPVVLVSWDDAVAHCRWAGLRLPTEAEWEKAARGTDGRIYPWGNAWDAARCNSIEGGKRGTTPVGAYSPAGDSPYDCADMAGNVWEWCADWYDDGYYRRLPTRSPTGPDSGQYRVLRGGSWQYDSNWVRSARRYGHHPDLRNNLFGFRCGVAAMSSP